jgi:hypothetical protein
MKDTLTAHYHKLSPTERLSLAIAAQARGDDEESARLRDTCPKVQYVAQIDLAYARKYDLLVSCALVHVGRLYRATTIWLIAQNKNPEVIESHLANISAIINSWQAFCNQAALDPAEVLNFLGQSHAVTMAGCFNMPDMPNDADIQAAMLADYLSAYNANI